MRAVLCFTVVVATTVSFWPSAAEATAAAPSPAQIASTQQEVAQLESTIAQQIAQGDALAQQYDAAQAKTQMLQAQLAATATAISTTKVQLVKDKAEMARVAMNAYIFSSPNASTAALFTSPATKSDALSEYEDSVVGDVGAISRTLETTQAKLLAQQSVQQTEQQQATGAAEQAKALAAANQVQTQAAEATLAQAKGALAQQIAEAATAQAEAAAAAASAAKTRASAQAAANAAAAAAAVAGAVGGASASGAANQAAAAADQSAGVSVSGTSTGSSAGAAAVSAALSQLGVPYVYGSEDPGAAFDCSGLTQWAWSQAGVTIPRTSESQWAELPHVSLTSLQPGDLIFTEGASPGHVLMYVGSGPFGDETVVQAPHTGTTVSYTSALFLGTITGAARP